MKENIFQENLDFLFKQYTVSSQKAQVMLLLVRQSDARGFLGQQYFILAGSNKSPVKCPSC